jgi:hypothetical protein
MTSFRKEWCDVAKEEGRPLPLSPLKRGVRDLLRDVTPLGWLSFLFWVAIIVLTHLS